jgi:hypothetical protein
MKEVVRGMEPAAAALDDVVMDDLAAAGMGMVVTNSRQGHTDIHVDT